MAGDKFSAVWVSHTSIADFLSCPRAYFLKNLYKDPQTGRKIKLMSPSLALGYVVHEVIESLASLPIDKRFEEPLLSKFERVWTQVSGKKGGFPNPEIENQYKNRGVSMLARITKNPGPLSRLAVKIKMDLPYYWLSEEDNIILCGKIDWLEYLPDTDSVHIIDFKTGKKDESHDSLQLPIYNLLVHGCQNRPVTRASYWYLDHNDSPTEVLLPDREECLEKVMRVSRQLKLARQFGRFNCESITGCAYCKPYEAILNGEAEHVGVNNYNHDVYILDSKLFDLENNSEII